MSSGQWYTRKNGLWSSSSRDPIGSFAAFAPGSVKPLGEFDAGTRNIGPRPGITLTEHHGDITLTSGQVVQGLDIYGTIRAPSGLASPPIVRDCIIRGHDKPTAQDAIARGNSYNFSGTVFEWCRFDATGRESMWNDCISGGNYTVRYSEILRGVDGIGANAAGNATIECCRIYKGYYQSFWNDATNSRRETTYTDWGGTTWTPPFISQASGDTHSDGVQIQGNAGGVIRGCYIGGQRGTAASGTNLDPTIQADYEIQQIFDADMSYRNAAIIINANAANPVGALIEHNWLEGGATRVNLSISGSDLLADVTLQNNRFIRSAWGGSPGYYIYAATGYQAVLSNNIFDDDETPVPIDLR